MSLGLWTCHNNDNTVRNFIQKKEFKGTKIDENFKGVSEIDHCSTLSSMTITHGILVQGPKQSSNWIKIQWLLLQLSLEEVGFFPLRKIQKLGFAISLKPLRENFSHIVKHI